MTRSAISAVSWDPTREEALRRTAAFVAHAGREYAAQRNYDRGPDDRANVSTLSPYLRRRMIGEWEVLAAVLSRHSRSAADKFIQEVFWRTYWKGWLEAHPSAWTRYRRALSELDAGPARAVDGYDAALAGCTGIDAFDAWARELVTTNYLHNHARMWFASIWIFTLRLPWELGADFFMRHLLDGDPASNTLSWRWVAGLHTRGRAYTATRDNIRRYTGERFAIDAALTRSAVPLVDADIPSRPLPVLHVDPLPSEPTLLVLHDDDLGADGRDLPAGMCGVCVLRADAGRSPHPVSPAVTAFGDAAAADATGRIAAAAGAADLGSIVAEPRSVAAAAERCGATRIVTPFAPVGPVRDVLESLAGAAAAGGRAWVQVGRRYDAVSWPAATRGFFNLRARIPAILSELELSAG